MLKKKYLFSLFFIVSFATASILGFLMNGKDAAAQLSDNVLLTKNRSTVEICIDSFVPDVANEKGKKLVEQVMTNTVTKNPKWNADYRQYDFVVKSTCNVTPYLLKKGTFHPVLSGEPDPGRVVKTASTSRVTIFIVPQQIKEKHFKNSKILTSPEEMLCEEDNCYEVTSGVYLSPQEFYTPGTLEVGLNQALAIEPYQSPLKKGPKNDGR